MSVTGSCLCGRFAFELHGELGLMTSCHCGYCRKSHGSAYATFVRAERLVWTAGGGGPAGPLDDDPGAKPMAHIYAASKAPWVEIRDDLARFDEMPDA